MKGISAMVAAVMLIAISVALGTMVAGWFSDMATTQSEKLENTTTERLSCQFADMYIINTTYNCSGNCSAGNNHTLTINVKNSGRRLLTLNTVVVKNTTGVIYSYALNETKSLSVSNTMTLTNESRTTCVGINNTIESIIVNSMNCPNTAFDSLPGADVTYVEC